MELVVYRQNMNQMNKHQENHCGYEYVRYCLTYIVDFVIGRAKRDPHWGVQSRFRVIYVIVITWV